MTELEVIVAVEITMGHDAKFDSNKIAFEVLKAIQRRYVIIELTDWNELIESSSAVDHIVQEQETYRLSELREKDK